MVETTMIFKWIYNLFAVSLATFLTYLGIMKDPFLIFAYLLLIDYATGLLKARAIKESITSNKMKYGIASKLSLLLIPIVIALGAKGVGADFAFVLVSSMTVLIISEVYSIVSNIYAIRYGNELPEYDVVALIGHKIRGILMAQAGDKDFKKDKES
jgi:phage-related holin